MFSGRYAARPLLRASWGPPSKRRDAGNVTFRSHPWLGRRARKARINRGKRSGERESTAHGNVVDACLQQMGRDTGSYEDDAHDEEQEHGERHEAERRIDGDSDAYEGG